MNRGVPLCQLWKWFRLHFQPFVLLVIVSVFLSKTLTLVVTVVTSTCCDQCLMPSHTYLTSCLLLHLYIWHKSITTCKFISAYIHLTWAMLDMSLLRQNIFLPKCNIFKFKMLAVMKTDICNVCKFNIWRWFCFKIQFSRLNAKMHFEIDVIWPIWICGSWHSFLKRGLFSSNDFVLYTCWQLLFKYEANSFICSNIKQRWVR